MQQSSQVISPEEGSRDSLRNNGLQCHSHTANHPRRHHCKTVYVLKIAAMVVVIFICGDNNIVGFIAVPNAMNK
jgi:hypothetical protein